MKFRWAPMTAAFAAAFCAVHAEAADPRVADCLAASDASIQLGDRHALRAERAQLLVCSAASCPADVRQECLRRVDDVSARIPTIVFSGKSASGGDLQAVRITMDGEVLATSLDGIAVPVDPGEHTFVFDAPGQPALTRKLLVIEGQRDRREVAVFGGPQAPALATPATLPTLATGSPAQAADSRGPGTARLLAGISAGLGVVGIGLGTAFAVTATNQKNAAQIACPGSACATQDGVNQWSSAASSGNAATVAFVTGGALLAGAAVLWLAAPGASSSASTRVGVGPAGLQLRGAW